MNENIIVLGIESSCDDTSAAVSCNDNILANVVAGQSVHADYGGVVPELASRAHLQKIVPVVDQALRQANVSKNDLSAVAFTTGPGLLGSLLVGGSFAKGLAVGLNIPLISVNHMQGHVLAHFARFTEESDKKYPAFPFICLTVSGGHTQLVLVRSHLNMEIIGESLDDAAGEAFDKVAKLLGLPYPGGPQIDRLAAKGDKLKYLFPHPRVPGNNFSFSGLKTSVLYFLQNNQLAEPDFIEQNLYSICASVQHTIVEILAEKLVSVSKELKINQIAISGGVSANSELRRHLTALAAEYKWDLFIPRLELCTDNAAMVAVTGYYKLLEGQLANPEVSPDARFSGMV
ncbi:MAG TPA: tRNA (adenosine(37)-N6)-threonylcarbamoyltransferase complex transferase subunit TsaD [Bacteroidia bacterium]|nr:tRNA (adenosine(37)-N6)-threonylcarbamoyltransferase complex transferase subunit TsaD [Bacteroidia bacterium]